SHIRRHMGLIITSEEYLNVSRTIYGGRHVNKSLENVEEYLPILKEHAETITPLRNLEQKINNCIGDHGQMLDSASVKLRSIRSSVRTFESRVREKLDHYTKSKASMLSDAIITIRNDRYVLPVKQEHRGSIGGIVHDQSASGQTLFMEPKAVVELNNQLQEAILQEKREI